MRLALPDLPGLEGVAGVVVTASDQVGAVVQTGDGVAVTLVVHDGGVVGPRARDGVVDLDGVQGTVDVVVAAEHHRLAEDRQTGRGCIGPRLEHGARGAEDETQMTEPVQVGGAQIQQLAAGQVHGRGLVVHHLATGDDQVPVALEAGRDGGDGHGVTAGHEPVVVVPGAVVEDLHVAGAGLVVAGAVVDATEGGGVELELVGPDQVAGVGLGVRTPDPRIGDADEPLVLIVDPHVVHRVVLPALVHVLGDVVVTARDEDVPGLHEPGRVLGPPGREVGHLHVGVGDGIVDHRLRGLIRGGDRAPRPDDPPVVEQRGGDVASRAADRRPRLRGVGPEAGDRIEDLVVRDRVGPDVDEHTTIEQQHGAVLSVHDGGAGVAVVEGAARDDGTGPAGRTEEHEQG